jgi:hypothetical protein
MDRRVAAWQSISVIPGRAEGANPESRNTNRACVWIPGPALTRRPGMTGEVCGILHHGRACPGHPRFACCLITKTWMPGIKPGMTENLPPFDLF